MIRQIVRGAGTCIIQRQGLRPDWKLHGLPETALSDRGPQFAAEFHEGAE